jgi:ABC-2 type transport system ATP-binding protein
MDGDIVIVHNLRKTYGDRLAVEGITFSIARGEIFGLLGPNGAGKSTTISMLSGLIEPTSGQILIDGLEMHAHANAIKARIGLVPQDLALYATLSARDNLIFFGQIYGLRGSAHKQRVAEVLEMVQLSERANDPVRSYSGGMKRRVNLAAGLLHRPEILFLDEPTVGVDPQSRNAIFESIEVLNRAGMTIIYTTHYMEEAQRLCQRVAILDHGQIIALDTPANLIRSLGAGLIRLEIVEEPGQAVKLQIEQLPSVQGVTQREQQAPTVQGLTQRKLQLDIQALNTQETLVDVLQITRQLDVRVTSLQILDANLETVFLNLTGKDLRE